MLTWLWAEERSERIICVEEWLIVLVAGGGQRKFLTYMVVRGVKLEEERNMAR